jgi:hypothetical protein
MIVIILSTFCSYLQHKKYFSLTFYAENVLCLSMHVSAYMSVFKPVIQDVVQFYQPTVIVLQVQYMYWQHVLYFYW